MTKAGGYVTEKCEENRVNGNEMADGNSGILSVTELVIAELMYLEWANPSQPIYVYINSPGTTRDDGVPVAMDSQALAIYDIMMQLKAEIYTLGLGAAMGYSCLLLACGKKGKRFMLQHAKAKEFGFIDKILVRDKHQEQEQMMSDVQSAEEFDRMAGIRDDDD
ncbi:hypothetical protein ACLOJK_026163 [Asimina triloba]